MQRERSWWVFGTHSHIRTTNIARYDAQALQYMHTLHTWTWSGINLCSHCNTYSTQTCLCLYSIASAKIHFTAKYQKEDKEDCIPCVTVKKVESTEQHEFEEDYLTMLETRGKTIVQKSSVLMLWSLTLRSDKSPFSYSVWPHSILPMCHANGPPVLN